MVEVCNMQDAGGDTQAMASKYNICMESPLESCSKDQVLYAKQACVESLSSCGLATLAWLDSCVKDVCAAAQSGDLDPLAVAEEACGPCLDFPDQCVQLTTTTTTTTEPTTLSVIPPPITCASARATQFDFKNAVLSTNNLGGMRSANQPAEMRWKRIAPSIDLVIKNITEYVTKKYDATGRVYSNFGQINQLMGFSTEFLFQFVKEGTNTPEVMDEFYFSFFDIDQFIDDKNRETLTVWEYDSFLVERTARMDVFPDGTDGMSFRSNKVGWGCDNPKDPTNLMTVHCCDDMPMFQPEGCDGRGLNGTIDQRERSVTFVFKNRSSFKARFQASGSPNANGGRNFQFAGVSSLIDLCPDGSATTTTTTLNANERWPLCAGTDLHLLPHSGSSPWQECVVPASYEQCHWYNEVKHKVNSNRRRGGMGEPLRVGTAFNNEAPHGCFLLDEGSDEFMGFNDNTGGTSKSFTHRLCCGAETVPTTTTTTTVPWILHDECLFNPCGMAPNTYDFPATPLNRPANAIVGTCLAWGDPHFLGFDVAKDGDLFAQQHFDHYGTGVYWIVNSPNVWVQGYYSPASRHRVSATYLRKVAISGPFLGKNTIMVETSNIWWNGQEHIMDFAKSGDQSWSGVNGQVIGACSANQDGVSVSLTFPLDVNISIGIKRFPRSTTRLPTMSALVSMRQILDQDGHCGTFNEDPTDDTHFEIKQRWYEPVPADQALLPL